MAQHTIQAAMAAGTLALAPTLSGVAAEAAAFGKNPVGYCLSNPAACTVAAEAVACTAAAGACPASSLVPNAGKVVTAAGGANRAAVADTASSMQAARLNMQLSAEQAAGVRAPTSIASYSDHALTQIAGRDAGIGVNQTAVIDAFANPVAIQYVPSRYGPTFKYIGQNATVVVNPQGNVVTTWGTSAAGVGK